MRTQLNVRIPDTTRQQIDRLTDMGYESQAHVVITAIDRLFTQERRTMKIYQVTLKEEHTKKPDGPIWKTKAFSTFTAAADYIETNHDIQVNRSLQPEVEIVKVYSFVGGWEQEDLFDASNMTRQSATITILELDA